MSTVLDAIMAERRADAAAAEADVPLAQLLAQAERRTHHSLLDALRSGDRLHVIAEMKKASPSAGMLRDSYEPGRIAADYLEAGACGLSVLTEPRHFQGSPDHLRAAREAVGLPILRKDFTTDRYQVAEAAAWGADVVLLIAAALAPEEIAALYVFARELGLDVLIESHTEEELALALEHRDAIVGVNSRNLKTLTTDLDVARSLAGSIPAERAAIAESGIRTHEELVELRGLGYDGFLIGESLLRGSSPGDALRGLLG